MLLADVRGAADRADVGMEALEFAARSLGAGGADLLLDVVERGKVTGSAALAAQARTLLEDEAVRKQASPALKALFSLQAAMKRPKCTELKALLPELSRSADERSLSILGRLAERRGCGFLGLGDCYGCLRSNAELTRTIELARGRPRPSFPASAPAPSARPASSSSKR
jgi:hypothetical protein